MPIYEFGCSQCNTLFERLLKMSEMETPLLEPCPECAEVGCIEQQLTAPNIADAIRLGIHRPDAGWGEVLSKIKADHPKGMKNQKFSPIAGR